MDDNGGSCHAWTMDGLMDGCPWNIIINLDTAEILGLKRVWYWNIFCLESCC
jgi:hypothetical protein